MAMETDEDDLWGTVTISQSASPPPSAAAISTALSLNTHLAASGGGCYRSVAPSLSSYYSAAASFPRLAPLHAGPARRALEREACLGHGAAAWPGAPGVAAPLDLRKKRMIKKRESASRSRARKHAHVTQIESEVHQLREENEQLRLKYDQLRASVEVSVPVRKTLQRVLSAPF